MRHFWRIPPKEDCDRRSFAKKQMLESPECEEEKNEEV